MPRWNPDQAVTIVTGASSGIGHCLCQLLVGRGAHVVAVARRRDRLEALAKRLGAGTSSGAGTPKLAGMPKVAGTLVPVAGDITDPLVRREVVQKAASLREGEIDLLVNNAGIGAIGPFAEASPDRLRRIMDVNFFAPVELTREALPHLLRGRSAVICNLGSVLGHRAVPDKSEYCASKFALHGWSDSLRAELACQGVQVTLVSPSTTRSEFFDALIDSEGGASKSVGSWSPDRVAKATLAAIESRRSEVICSLAGKTLVYADRLAPPLMNALLAKSAR